MTDHDSTQIFRPMMDNANSSVLTPGQKVGNYVIEQVLGIGGFGIVYLASHEHMARQVAVKEFFPSAMATRDSSSTVRLSTEAYSTDFYKSLDNFLAEANNLTRVEHPGLVRVYDFWKQNGTAYMAMQS